MADDFQCSQCGASLLQGAREGVCPQCRLQEAQLRLGTNDPGVTAGAAVCQRCGSPTPDAELVNGLCPRCLVMEMREMNAAARSRPPVADSKPRAFGDYELLEELARGGMGVVYRARQKSLNRIVAVKLILSSQLAGPAAVQRFRREAEAAANLQHPNIVAIHEIGEAEGEHFYSMDFVAGQSLSQVARDTPLPPKQAARYVQKIAEAIHYAHQRGILHRDLKPSNVLIDQNDEPRVADFGLAKLMAADSEMTMSGTVMGSPSYMPPEQASGRSREVTVRSDVYSLGAILYDVLCGRPPFRAETTMETLRQVVEMEPVLPRVLNPKAPRDLETIVVKCLQKQPDRRYATAEELSEELARFQRGEPIQARPVGSPEKLWRWCKRKPALATALSLLVTIAVGSPIAAFRINQQRKLAELNRRLAEDRLYVADMTLGYQALLDGNFARARELLATYHAQKPDRRGFEWRYLWDRTRGDFEHNLVGHSNPVRKVVWSPDGQLLASHSMDRKVKIWSSDGKERLTLTNISALAGFSADSTRLFVGQNSNAVIAYHWQTRTQQLLLDGVGDLLSVLPDDRTAATTTTNFALRLWNTSTREMVVEILGTGGFLTRDSANENPAVAVSKDGKRAAVAQRGDRGGVETITIWDVVAQKQLLIVSEQRDAPPREFSPDNALFAVGGAGGFVRLWDTVSNREPRTIQAHEVTVRGLTFSRDGKVLATGSSDQTIKLWDVASGKNLATLRGHEHSMPSLEFAPDNKRLASCSWDETIKIWELNRPTAAQTISGFKLETYNDAQPIFSEDGRFAAALCVTDEIRVWDTTALREIANLPAAGIPLQGGFSRDGKTLLTFANTELRLYDIGSQTVVKRIRVENPPSHYKSTALCAHTGLLAVSDPDFKVGVWDSSTGRKQTNFGEVNARVVALSFSSAGNFLAGIEIEPTSANRFATSPRLHLWGGKPLTPLTPLIALEFSSINSFAFTPDERFIATIGRDRTVYLWELATRRLFGTFKGHRQQVQGLAFSPGGQLLATGSSDGTIKLWDVLLRRELGTLKFNETGTKWVDERVTRVSISPDGNVLLATSQDGSAIRFFRAPTWEQIARAEKQR